MRSFAIPGVLFLVACGGGGGNDGTQLTDNQGEGAGEGAQPTALELFGTCFQQDATQLAQILGLLETFFAQDGGEIPLPTLDLISGFLSGGTIPYTWDLDGDAVHELTGTLRFLDENGGTTIPFSLAELSGLDLENPAALLEIVPPGARLELVFDVGGSLLAATNAGEGAGTLIFRFGDETITGVAGTGTLESGECLFEIDFDEIEIDLEEFEGYPVADVAFTAGLGDDRLAGTIALDGSDTATLSASLNGADPEQTTFDLPELEDLLDLLESVAGGAGDER